MSKDQEKFLKLLFLLCEEYKVNVFCEGETEPGRYSVKVEIPIAK